MKGGVGIDRRRRKVGERKHFSLIYKHEKQVKFKLGVGGGVKKNREMMKEEDKTTKRETAEKQRD